MHNSRRPSFSRRPSYRVAFANDELVANTRLSETVPASDGAQPPTDSSEPVVIAAVSDPSPPVVDASDVLLTELSTSQLESTNNAVVEEAFTEPSKIEVEKEEVEEGPSEADQLRKMLEQELHLIEKNHYPIPVRKIRRSVHKPLNGNGDALDADGALVGASEEGQNGHGEGEEVEEEEEDSNVVAYAAKNAQLREEYEVYISRLMNKLMVSVCIYLYYLLYFSLILRTGIIIIIIIMYIICMSTQEEQQHRSEIEDKLEEVEVGVHTQIYLTLTSYHFLHIPICIYPTYRRSSSDWL